MATRFWLPHRVLFHYTSAHDAEALRRDALDGEAFFVVGVGAHYGHGLYATDLDPFETSPEEVNTECFHGTRSTDGLNGVLVLDADRGAFERVLGHIWLLEEQPLAAIDLVDLLVGTGVHDDVDGWTLRAL